MELRQLRYFVAVVEAGSLTAAATRLHLSQPPLSVAMAKLEAEVGVPLLVRSPRGVEPTSAGRFLLEASARVLSEVEDIRSALGRFAGGVAGSLTLAAVPVLMWHRLPALVRSLATEVPDLEVRLVDPPPWTAIELLRQRQVDLAAVVVADHRRFVARYRGTFEVVDWGEVPLVAALPPELSDLGDPLPLDAFEGEVVLVPRSDPAVPSLPEAVAATFRRHGVVPSSLRVVETIQAGIPLIEAGVARAVLPDPDRASLARFDLTVRRLEPEPRPLRALVLSRPGAAEDARVRRLLERVAQGRRHSSAGAS